MSPTSEAATSTSPETSRRASPSNRRLSRAFLAALAAGTAALLLARMPWPELRARLDERRALRVALAPLLRQAEETPLTYPQVVSTFPAYAGRVVYWDVTTHPDSTYVGGRQGWPVAWTNPARVEVERFSSGKVLARVASVKAGIVQLDYLGKP